jgi:hypothetical protein
MSIAVANVASMPTVHIDGAAARRPCEAIEWQGTLRSQEASDPCVEDYT